MWLAKGYSNRRVHISVEGFVPNSIGFRYYPDCGTFESFKEIKDLLDKEFAYQFPKIAFPKAVRENDVALYGRDPDSGYLLRLGTFNSGTNSKNEH